MAGITMMGSSQPMSKKLEKRAARLVRKAETRADSIRRVVREYKEAVQTSSNADPSSQLGRQFEIEQAVVRYNQVHKALRRLRKKMETKSNNNGSLQSRPVKRPSFR